MTSHTINFLSSYVKWGIWCSCKNQQELTVDTSNSDMQMPSLLKSPPHISSISYKNKLVANQSHNYFTQLSSINETDLIDEGDNIHLGTSFIPITSKDKKKDLSTLSFYSYHQSLWKNSWLQIFTS